jgi:hypothetical protein
MLLIGLGNRLSKMAGLGAKKEKKKETQILSMPMYIRDTRDQRLAATLPAID